MKNILSHIALLVSSVDQSAAYLSFLGIKCGQPEVFDSEGTKEIYVGDYQDQSALLLLLEPICEGPYKRAMSKRGPSLHHMAFDVLDMKEFLAEAEKVGWQRLSISHSKTSWLSCKGLPLLEINEKKMLSDKPAKISEIQMPVEFKNFSKISRLLGLNLIYDAELSLVIEGKKIKFSELA